MAEIEQWTCSVCGRHATIGKSDRVHQTGHLTTETSLEQSKGLRVELEYVVCPNPKCTAEHLEVAAWHGAPQSRPHYTGFDVVPDFSRPAGIGDFRFLPTTTQPLSATVPASVLNDYTEAFLIRSLSPKASATLARRALQGMIRDFWGVTKGTLHAELEAIRDKCDPAVYDAMMHMKSIGNIGAHPERDISTIVDIEPEEAQQLLDLIHLLDHEWYVARAQKKVRLDAMNALAAAKKPPPVSPAPP